MTRRFPTATLLGLIALAPATRAQDRPDATAKTSHTTYIVRHGDPAALAAALSKHFKGQAAVSVLPAGAGNTLLISGTPGATAELAKLLEQADQPARTVEVEVALAEVSLKKGDDGKEAAEPDLTGTGAAVLARLEALGKAGSATLRRVKLTAVEGRPVETMTGGDQPMVTTVGGPQGGRGGANPFVQRSVTYRPTGSTVKVTARVGPDNVVLLDLSVSDSRIKPPAAADEAAAMETGTLVTRLAAPAGRAVTAQVIRTDGKAERTVSVVVVTAQVTAGGAVASR